jgi:hypothetical protein
MPELSYAKARPNSTRLLEAFRPFLTRPLSSVQLWLLSLLSPSASLASHALLLVKSTFSSSLTVNAHLPGTYYTLRIKELK